MNIHLLMKNRVFPIFEIVILFYYKLRKYTYSIIIIYYELLSET